MTSLLAPRTVAVGRAVAAALLVVALAVSMQESRASAAASFVGGLAVVAAFSMWSASPTPLWRALALASSGLFLVAATADSGPASPAGYALARAAGPFAVAAAAVSVLPRRSAWWAAMGGLVAGGLHASVFDPFLEPSCRACEHVGFAVWADADRARMVWVVGWLVLAGALIPGIRRQRSIAPLMLVPAVAYAADPHHPTWLVLCILTPAVATTVQTVRRRSSQIKLQRLLASYEITGGELTDSLRALFSDPGLTIGYPVVDEADAATGEVGAMTFIDANGQPLPATAGFSTDLASGGELLARISHSAALPSRPEGLVDPLTVLILYRQRATAQLAAEVARLTERRRDVATAGLVARGRLERDLHDGVQQELLALGLAIRLAMAQQDGAETEQTASLASALALVHDSVDQVRAISTGISPPMLATHGIRGAITALARRRGVTVDTDRITSERFGAEVEQAAFAALSEALVNDSRNLSAVRQGDVLRLASGGAATSEWVRPETSRVGVLTDLFAALGGSFVADDRYTEATLPCGS